MIVNKKDLSLYLNENADLVPIHPWNKQRRNKKGVMVPRGKTPVDADWTVKEYSAKSYEGWAKNGYNFGYRLGEHEVVIDMDPRNYDGDVDVEDKLAEAFGYDDFDALLENERSVETGGGGYHIYTTLPDRVDCRNLREVIEEYPGLEFKHKGRQVLCAGSKHPSGEHYEWLNKTKPDDLPDELIELIEFTPKDSEHEENKGILNGPQLEELFLNKIDVTEYGDNDSWFSVMCAAHHATNGEGVEEFLQWSLGDPSYECDETTIRSRWESMSDEKDNNITVGTLVHELGQSGEETADLLAALTFSELADRSEVDEDDSVESEVLDDAKRAVDEIDLEEVYGNKEGDGTGDDGAAIAYATTLDKFSSAEDKMKAIRLIKAATMEEGIEAQEILIANRTLNQAGINKRLKAMEAKIIDSVMEIIANITIERQFKKGKHITCEPNGQLWAFHKTHWKQMTDEFLGKIVYGVLDSLKTKMHIEGAEVNYVTNAVKSIRIRCSKLTARIYNPTKYLPIINCQNGELWINKDGSHSLKRHSYKSYQTTCLRVDYSPEAEAPLFYKTMSQIFAKFDDTEEMVDHLCEIMGYSIQPYKPLAAWWLFRGPGGDGKSTVLKILGGILEDAQLDSNESILSAGSNSGDNHATASLVGKLSVVIEELPAHTQLKDAGVKLLSENKRMTANPKIKGTFPFLYIGSLFMCSNGYPIIRDLSYGMQRRANVIPFNQSFTFDKREDIDRAQTILSDPKEMAGVLNLMLDGYKRVKKRGGFADPLSCKIAKDEWMLEANNVVRFIKENIKKKQTSLPMCKASVMYARYKGWCSDSGITPKGRNGFHNDLKSCGFEVRHSTGNVLHIFGGELLDEDGYDDFDGCSDDEWEFETVTDDDWEL